MVLYELTAALGGKEVDSNSHPLDLKESTTEESETYEEDNAVVDYMVL